MSTIERPITFDERNLPDWVMPMKLVAKQLGALGDSQLGKEIINDYQQFLLKLNDAYIELRDDHQKTAKTTVFDQSLGDSELTIDWLRKNIEHVASYGEAVERVHCEILSTDGFVSQIMRIRLLNTHNNSSNIVVKIPETRAIKQALEKTVGKQKAEKYLPTTSQEHFSKSLVAQFNRELDFYGTQDIKGLKLPEIFFSQKWELNKYTGALAMEDLSSMQAVSFFESLTFQQVENLCQQLMILQVHSQKMAQFWEETFQYPDSSLSLLCKLQDVVEVFVERNEDLRSVYLEVQHLYSNPRFFEYTMMKAHTDIGLDNVICHGDLWTYNFLWIPDENGKASDKVGAIIDWQNVHVGSIGEDLGRLLVFCCDAETRRKIELNYLPRYFEELRDEIEKRNGKWNTSWPQFLAAYRACFVAHALHLPFLANVMLSIKSFDDNIQKEHNKLLVERVKAAWEDAIEILKSDLQKWV